MKERRLEEVGQALEDPRVWEDPKRAQELGREKKSAEAIVQKMRTLESAVRDSGELFAMARSDDDDATLVAVDADVTALAKQVADLEFQRMFNNPLDPNNCFIEIQAGAGGTEAQDWAAMLERMYLRYAERRKFKSELLDETSGEVAGIKGATIKLIGDYAFGMLRTETGITDWCANRHLIRTRGGIRRLPACSYTRKSTRRSRWSIQPICASTCTERRCWWAARQQDRIRSARYAPSKRHRRAEPE